MKYYALKFEINVSDPEGEILWETESESENETMSLINKEPGFEYEVVSENDIMEEVQKYYDLEEHLH